MATFTYTLEGGDELKRAFDIVGVRAQAIGVQVIIEEANNIFNKSQVLVPVDTGALRGSGGVSAPTVGSDGVGVDIFYGGPAASYALMVHEITQYYHNPPTQAKYLEQPFMEALPNLRANMSRRIIDLIEKEVR